MCSKQSRWGGAVRFRRLAVFFFSAWLAQGSVGAAENGGFATEFFTGDKLFDLAGNGLTFKPDAVSGRYVVERDLADAFPSDSADGTLLSLSDDSYEECVLSGGATVSLFGVAYDRFYVGSNGYITFGEGDTGYSPSLEDHFWLPRVAALFWDLFPGEETVVSWKQLADRAVVTYQGIEDIDTGAENHFQIELFFNGNIRITYLAIGSTQGIVGLSDGGEVPSDFVETDFSAYAIDPLRAYFSVAASFYGYRGGPFLPAEVAGVITNSGDAELQWTLVDAPEWLAVSPAGGTLAVGAAAGIALCANARAAELAVGQYEGSVAFSNLTSGRVIQKVPARLAVKGDVAFSAAVYTVTEADGAAAEITVTRCGHTNLAMSVNYAAADGSATAGNDYLLAAGSLAFAPGETEKRFFLPILNDWLFEGDETVVLTLSGMTGGGLLGEPWRTEVRILEDDLQGEVALFAEPAFVDTSAGTEGEVGNLSAAIRSKGCLVTPFTGWSAASFSNALSGVSVACLPEMEAGNLAEALDASAAETLRSFVAGGGRMIVHADSSGFVCTLLNNLFDFSLSYGSWTPGMTLFNPGTEFLFQGMPATLAANDATWALALSSLPARAQSLYQDDAGTSTTVALIPYGQGIIVFMGYDWSDAVPAGTQDGGWDAVLEGLLTEMTASDTLRVFPSQALTATGYEGGPFVPSGAVYTLGNLSSNALEWSVLHAPVWVTVRPGSGTVAAHESDEVTVAFNAEACSLPVGAYVDAIVFTNGVTGKLTRREVALTVQGDLAFSSAAYVAGEGNEAAEFTVVRGGHTNLTMTVDYATADGTATAGSDYLAVSGTLAFAPGETEKRVVVPILDNWLGEPRETLRVTLANLTGGGRFGEPTAATLTIVDNDQPTVSLFADPSYVDTSSDTGGEVENVREAITNRACEVISFTGTSAAAFEQAVSVGNVLYIPETENGSPDLNIDAEAAGVISNFVAGGGCLIVNYYSGLLNAVFGFGISNSSPADGSLLAAAAGTVFEGGPASLGNNDATDGLLISSLPAGAKAVYQANEGACATVALIPFGAGKIIFLGYDWYDAVPRGSQDNGWDEVMGRALHAGTGVSLPAALDTGTAAEWTTEGAVAWIGYTNVTHDNVDAAWVGGVGNRQRAGLKTQVTGPCDVSFWWRVSCEDGWDGLAFYVDGKPVAEITGESGWQAFTHALTNGTHALEWAYQKDAADLDPVGLDCAWLDQVKIKTSILPWDWLALYNLAIDGSEDYADSDGDGMNNWNEYLAGTVPTDIGSALRMLRPFTDSAEGGMRVRWQSVAGRRYVAESCESLTPPIVFTPFVSNVVGQAGVTEVLDGRPAASGVRFYRVGVQP